MHKSLRLDNLAYLPISVRRFASPAANGSIDDLKRLITLLDEIHSEHTFAQCLPVFYANLDPGGIPTGVNVTTDEVTRAIMALDALHKLGVESKPAWQDLWTRIWPWIAFLHVHRGCLAQERDARPYLMFFLNLFCRDLDTKTLISQTDGVRSLIMEAWAFMLYTEKVDDRAFSRLSTLFPDMEVNDDKNLAELLEGAGGPIGSASIILKSIKKFVPNPRIPDGNIRDLEDVVQFLASFALCWDEESPRSISSALVSSGVVGALTAAACTIGDSHLRHSSAAGILLQSCNILRELLASHHAMRDSLRAGLLRLIIYGATIEIGRDGSSELGMTLATLRGFTVYYTVVAELEVGLRDVEHIVKAQEFQDSDFFQPWCDFVALANDRIALMKELHAKTSVSLKACDNMGCGVINPRADFKRCSHCQRVYYCSADCQKIDWRSGGHRDMCQSMTFKTDDLGARNRSFMCALMHRDLTEHKYRESPVSTDPSRLSYLAEVTFHDTLIPLVTVMDYTKGYPRMWIDGVDGPRTGDVHHHVHLDEDIARWARSGGQMELHLAIIRGGDHTRGVYGSSDRRLMFPQRSNRPSLHHGLLQILRERDQTGAQDKTQQLMEADKSLVKIHVH